jgi:hypothetical protein
MRALRRYLMDKGTSRKNTYAGSRADQAEFEELEREEDDWQEAVDDVREGKKPSKKPDRPPSSGA